MRYYYEEGVFCDITIFTINSLQIKRTVDLNVDYHMIVI